jgi:hypothetical protein
LFPSSVGFQAGELIKGAPLAGRKYAHPALNDWLGERKLIVLDRVDPEVIEASEGVDGRKKTDITFHESNIGRKLKNGVAKEMVGLKLVEVEKAPEEIRRRKAKAVLKMGGEDHDFT